MVLRPDAAIRRRRLGFILAIATVGAAARLLTFSQVFTPHGTRFVGDNDPLYHVLRAERIAADYPAVPWSDPNLNYPTGALIPWPPLFDKVIAASAMLAGRGHPTHSQVERAAALVPVAFAVGTLPLVVAVGAALFDWELGLAAAFFLALLPEHITYSALGRPDQHVAELFVFTWILLAFAHGWTGKERRGVVGWFAPTALGIGIAVAFWTWQGSALHLVLPVLFAGAWHIAAPVGDDVGRRVSSTLARGGAIGAGLLVLSLAVLGPPGALSSMRLDGITGVQPAIALLAGTFGALLFLLPRVLPGVHGKLRRIVEVVLAATLPSLAAVAVSPTFRAGLKQGLVALGAANPWYSQISEFRPIIDPARGIWHGILELAAEFGIGPLLMTLSVPAMLARWARREDRPGALFVSLLGLLFVGLTAIRARFALYLGLPIVLFAALFAREARTTISRRLPYVGFAMVSLIFGAKAISGKPILPDAVSGDLLQALEWLREVPLAGDRRAVLSRWDWGHAVQYYAHKPVIVSPFGTEGGERAMQDAAQFYLSTTGPMAAEVLARREVGFIVLDNPLNITANLMGFAPSGTPQIWSVTPNWLKGNRVLPTEAFWRLVPARLFFSDGSWQEGSTSKALATYRLLYETRATGHGDPLREAQLKVFGVVPGAIVTAATQPKAAVTASVSVRTNQGRTFTWTAAEQADGYGRATFSLPYATGRNGEVLAGPYMLTDGHARSELALSEAAVQGGGSTEVVLSGASMSRVASDSDGSTPVAVGQ